MKIIPVGAELSQIYTNHSVRASAITLLSDPNIPDRHIMFVSGHSSEQSLVHYSSRPSETQLESVSDTISNAVENNQPQSTEISTITKAPLIQSSNRMASNVYMSTATASFPSGFFNACNFQGNVQVFLMTKSELHFQCFVLDLYILQFNFCFLSDFVFHGKLHLFQV